MARLAKIIISITLVVVFVACNNKTDKESKSSTDSTSVTELTTGADADSTPIRSVDTAAMVNIPIFRITSGNMADALAKGPKKLLLTMEFLDLTNPGKGINLLLYSAKNHGDYGKGDKPITINDQMGTKSISSHFIVGNNEIPFHPFLSGNSLKDFDYVLLTPRILPIGPEAFPHLIFDIAAYKEGKPIRLILDKDRDTDLLNTNPSPPRPPSD